MVATSAIALRKALESDEVIPYFQPLVELRTGALIGFEALARWRHTVQGPISPDVFIPLAEENGLIGSLTRNLLRHVFTAAATIPEHLSISFNISAIQFHDRSLSRQTRETAQQAGFSLDRLILEITESALIDNVDQAQTIAHELKTLGIRLALDDFGTGYSSLRHLQSLPFDEIKVDASFIREMSDRRESRKIVAAIVGLGHSLGLTTVAEGIETREQSDMLLRLGCDIGQGWLYGPPVPVQDLPDFLSAGLLAPPIESSAKFHDDDVPPNLEALPTQRLAQLQAIYDGAPVGLAFLDRNLRYVSINKHLAAINQHPIADHLGRYPYEIVPEIFPQFEPYLRRTLTGEAFTDLEVSMPNAEGEVLTFLVSFQPARDEVDEVIGVSVAIIDITSRKLAEDALRASETLLRAVFDAVPVGLIFAEWPSNRVVMSNPRAEALFGRAIPPGEDMNAYRRNASHPDGRLLSHEEYPSVRAMRTGKPTDPEDMLYPRGPDVQAWIRASAAPVRGKDGSIAGAVLSILDLDKVIREKQELLHRIAELERQLKASS
jgi:PAS domain S-box-containing protein